MTLTIEVNNFSTGLEMENNFNKAIADFGEALKERGCVEMELIGYSEEITTNPTYKVTIKKTEDG